MFHWKGKTVHISYWIFENGRCLCVDLKEISSNGEHSWSSTRSVLDIFIDRNNTLIQLFFLLLQAKANTHFIYIRIGIITKKTYGQIFVLFCFLKCKPANTGGGKKEKKHIFRKTKQVFHFDFHKCLSMWVLSILAIKIRPQNSIMDMDFITLIWS